jgi:hypothetical protein
MKKKRTLVTIGIILLGLILTNPTMNDFKDFIGDYGAAKKKYNFIVFSIYYESPTLVGASYHRIEYVGICKNFIRINVVR